MCWKNAPLAAAICLMATPLWGQQDEEKEANIRTSILHEWRSAQRSILLKSLFDYLGGVLAIYRQNRKEYRCNAASLDEL